MRKMRLDYSLTAPEITSEKLSAFTQTVKDARNMLVNKSGKGNDFLGWLKPQDIVSAEDFANIKETVKRLKKSCDTMVVIGIGGSYLGARTVIEALGDKSGIDSVIFAGQTLSVAYTKELLETLESREFCIAVISKSGTTTEPAAAFRILKELLINKVGEEVAVERIVAITDPDRGALREMATEKGYETYPIPANVGGRFSVFSAVGLLPIAFAGIDIDELILGAKESYNALTSDDNPMTNKALMYAAIRNILYREGKKSEVTAIFEPRLHYMIEWWKQLYGESEGKDGLGIFPVGAEFTTDLHSMGQYLQDGERTIFETFVVIDGGFDPINIPKVSDNLDGLDFLVGADIDAINKSAFMGTVLAHRDGDVPVLIITLPDLSAKSIGELLYFYQFACGVSGYILGVNPFDQPAVEDYKTNMFALLNKPKYEEKGKAVRERVENTLGKFIVD